MCSLCGPFAAVRCTCQTRPHPAHCLINARLLAGPASLQNCRSLQNTSAYIKYRAYCAANCFYLYRGRNFRNNFKYVLLITLNRHPTIQMQAIHFIILQFEERIKRTHHPRTPSRSRPTLHQKETPRRAAARLQSRATTRTPSAPTGRARSGNHAATQQPAALRAPQHRGTAAVARQWRHAARHGSQRRTRHRVESARASRA